MTQQEFDINSRVLLDKVKEIGIALRGILTSFKMDTTYLGLYGTVLLEVNVYCQADTVFLLAMPQKEMRLVYRIGKSQSGRIIEWKGFDVAKLLHSPF
jgi:hypothetical protein